MKVFKLILFILFLFGNYTAYSLGGRGNANTTILGPSSACGTTTHQIIPRDSESFSVKVIGGSFVNQANLPVINAICGNIFGVLSENDTRVTFTNCNPGGVAIWDPISLNINWFGNGSITVTTLVGTNTTSTYTKNITSPPGINIVGSNGPVCSSTSQLSFSTSGGGGSGATVQWSAISTGPPLNIQSPTSALGTLITGFQPGNMYSINLKTFCGGTLVHTSSATIITVLQCMQVMPTTELQGEIFNGIPKLEDSPNVKPVTNNNIDERDKYDFNKSYLKQSTIFPNPIRLGGNINIAIPDIDNMVQIRIIDGQGRMIKELQTNEYLTEINTNVMSAGSYFIQIIANKEVTTKKLILID